MNHQIIAAITLGNSMRAFQDSPPEVAAGVAVISLMQMDKSLSQEEASHYVLTALAEIANIPFSLKDIKEEALKMGVDFPVH